MVTFSKAQYDFARSRVRDLQPFLVVSHSSAVELSIMSAVVSAYEREYLPILFLLLEDIPPSA